MRYQAAWTPNRIAKLIINDLNKKIQEWMCKFFLSTTWRQIGLHSTVPLIVNFDARWGKWSTSHVEGFILLKEPRCPLSKTVDGPRYQPASSEVE